MSISEYLKKQALIYAEIVDAWRIAPRAVLAFYGWMLWEVTIWFKDIPAPTAEQSGVVMAFIGSAALIFNFYAKSGRAWGPQVEWENIGQNDYLASQRDNYYRGNGRSYRSRPQNNRRTNRRSDKNDNVEEGDV